ncbi:hypothetical protein [Bacillus kwashiorkori]|uniref:hypothetical protein n=1 Tax=Bacillus kwashiorkori TaxID=1522318 RepID=UPI0007802F0A|nr:hypothetical protein [Bacillus kwashiorkori]
MTDFKDEYKSAQTNRYDEETAAEMAVPINRTRTTEQTNAEQGGRGLGIAALVLSILALFMAPVLFGGAGVVLGFMAKKRGANSLGNWAIGVGAFAAIIGLLIAPFF